MIKIETLSNAINNAVKKNNISVELALTRRGNDNVLLILANEEPVTLFQLVKMLYNRYTKNFKVALQHADDEGDNEGYSYLESIDRTNEGKTAYLDGTLEIPYKNEEKILTPYSLRNSWLIHGKRKDEAIIIKNRDDKGNILTGIHELCYIEIHLNDKGNNKIVLG